MNAHYNIKRVYCVCPVTSFFAVMRAADRFIRIQEIENGGNDKLNIFPSPWDFEVSSFNCKSMNLTE